jgi:hypothetical protein
MHFFCTKRAGFGLDSSGRKGHFLAAIAELSVSALPSMAAATKSVLHESASVETR